MERDRGLDNLKGAACLLMVLAHGVVDADGQMAILGLKFLGQFAPVFFFAVSGITGYMQAKRKPVSGLILFYSLFFLLGFTYNGILVSDYWHVAQADILQCIALSAIVIVLLSRRIAPVHFLWMVPIPFYLHLLFNQQPGWSDWPLSQFIFAPRVFPLFPWLAFFFMGISCYFLTIRKNGVLLALLTAAFLLTGRFDFAGEFTNKWNMSLRFFLLGCLGISGAMLGLKVLKDRLSIRLLEFIGKNSLLFLFCHMIPIYGLEALEMQVPWIVWPVVFAGTVLLMGLFIKLNRFLPEQVKQSPYFWMVIVLFVLINPYLFRYKLTVKALSAITGILIGLNYHKLNGVIGTLQQKWHMKREESAA